ncbi:hypothetical protein B0H21DRAFT_819692 [Amylocystis lapponica]|nr:hypothetical protein B0H21DRAFT_819692 [Amylocystis lapponica]
MSQASILRALTVLSLVHEFCAAQYAPLPRQVIFWKFSALIILPWSPCRSIGVLFGWGQAVALVEDVMLVEGGRTDQYNTYSYTSAPVNNDMLSLPLTSSFNISSPPWDSLSGCSNCSLSSLLVFGGDQNTTTSVPESADSAALVDITNPSSPAWHLETLSWADEPERRMFHSASSTGGKIYVIGGEKTDGSGNAFSDHYVFDPSVPSFTLLPSTNGPPDVYGHTSLVLSNGSLIVFGAWTTLSVSSSTLPSPRRGFAATLLDGDKVLIHGGADAELQTSYSDGWILDTTQAPMVWTSIGTLSQLGARRDHFAVALGTQVIFGFGYMANGPAPAALQLFDLSAGSFSSLYSPPSSITSPSATTIPGPAPTITTGPNRPSSGPGGSSAGNGNGSGSLTGTADGTSGTSAGSGGQNNSGGNGSGSGGGGDDGGGDDSSGASHQHDTTAIALSTVFGVLGLLAGTAAAVWYVRRQHSRERFHRLGTSTDNENFGLGGMIPIAGTREKVLDGLPPVVQNVRSRLSVFVPHRTVLPQDRRDMLADEDTRMFDFVHVRRDASSGRSSWSSGPSRRATLGNMVHESLASLRSVGGTVLAYAAGSRGVLSREGSAGSHTTAWWDKERGLGPFSDDTALMQEGAVGVSRSTSRLRGERRASASVHSYVDPFADYAIEESEPPKGALDDDDDEDDLDYVDGPPSLLDPPPRPYAYIKAPATIDLTRLSPLSERPSVATLPDPANSSDSHTTPANTPGGSSSGDLTNSRSSHDTSRSPLPRPSSIIDANQPPSQPMRRSDTWWSRFAKTPLLDRRSSDASRRQLPLDFRDPQPAPRLVPIEESAHSNQASQDTSPPSRLGSRRQNMYSSTQHGRSASSLQTARSDMLEHVGRTMDIVQKGTVSSHGSEPSRTSTADERGAPAAQRRPPSYLSQSDSEDDVPLVQSPVELASPAVHRRASPPKRPPSGTQVAARVQAFERRMTEADKTTRARASAYGVAPRPSLFIANPDHRTGTSGDST